MKIKLAEALLRRKELEKKVDQLQHLVGSDVIYAIRAKRIKVTDGLEDLEAEFPKLDAKQVTAEYDHFSRALRLIDGAIQQANWTTELDIDDKVMNEWVTPNNG